MIYLPVKELKTSSNYVSIDAGLTVLKLTYSVSVYKYATMNIICLIFVERAIFSNCHVYSSLYIVGNNNLYRNQRLAAWTLFYAFGNTAHQYSITLPKMAHMRGVIGEMQQFVNRPYSIFN